MDKQIFGSDFQIHFGKIVGGMGRIFSKSFVKLILIKMSRGKISRFELIHLRGNLKTKDQNGCHPRSVIT